MRLLTWNCRVGGFRKKARHVAPFRPDVLAVQEVEPIEDTAILGGELQPTFRSRIADPAYPRRAIGVFSYTDTALEPVDDAEPMYCFRRFAAQHRGISFQVVAVWTAATTPRKDSYRQAHDGIQRHRVWIQSQPTIILGDFNGNASYQGGNWRELLELMQRCQLVSAYHHYFGEAFGRESQPTHYHKNAKEAPFHLDYCFLPQTWTNYITAVRVGTHVDWREASDHVPLIVDLMLPGETS